MVCIDVNSILQIITGSGHFIINHAVRPKDEFAIQALLSVLKAPYARFSFEEIELALTTNPVSLTSLSDIWYITNVTFLKRISVNRTQSIFNVILSCKILRVIRIKSSVNIILSCKILRVGRS